MAVEDFIIKMVDITKGNGKIIKWMDMVNSTMKVVSLPMKDNGLKTSLMALEKYTTIIL